MMTFRCDDGSIHEVLGNDPVAHPEGARTAFIDDDGDLREGVRLVVAFEGGLRTKGVACVSTQTRKWDPDVKKYDPDGRAVFDTPRDYQDFIDRKSDRGENWSTE